MDTFDCGKNEPRGVYPNAISPIRRDFNRSLLLFLSLAKRRTQISGAKKDPDYLCALYTALFNSRSKVRPARTLSTEIAA